VVENHWVLTQHFYLLVNFWVLLPGDCKLANFPGMLLRNWEISGYHYPEISQFPSNHSRRLKISRVLLPCNWAKIFILRSISGYCYPKIPQLLSNDTQKTYCPLIITTKNRNKKIFWNPKPNYASSTNSIELKGRWYDIFLSDFEIMES